MRNTEALPKSRRDFGNTWILALTVIVVVLLHQDFWFWENKTLIFGFLPIGLAYHLGYTLLAAATLGMLVRFAWPAQLQKDNPPEQ